MKLQGYLKGVGKLGNIVVTRVGGATIARDYNPNIANPNTVAQTNQRARLKLASQLAAALSPVIAIPKQGLQSARNLFIQRNMSFITANAGIAQISYENIQLTAGNVGLPAITASRDAEDHLNVALQGRADAAVSRVVYVLYKKTTENQLQLIGSHIVSVAGENGTFPLQTADVDGDIIIWAYGMKDRSASASARYGDYSVEDGEDIAQLVLNRSLSTADFQFTQTRGTTIFDDESSTVDPDEDQVMVYITSSGPGSVSGEGFVGNRKAVDQGASVTVVATPSAGASFLGWYNNSNDALLSSSATYTFTANALTDIIAKFQQPNENGDMN